MGQNSNFASSAQEKKAVTWLSRGYLLALTLIIALTLFSHTLTSRLVDKEIIGAEISFVLSNQITLINQVEHYASSYYSGREELDYTLMDNSLSTMKSSIDKIAAYIDTADTETSSRYMLKKSMRSGLILEDRLKDYIKAADDYIAILKEPKSLDPAYESKHILDTQKALKHIKDLANSNLTRLLQLSLADYQEQRIKEIHKLHELQFYMTYGIVFVIIMEALFIFRPLVRKVEKSQLSLIKQALEDPLTELKNRRAFTKDFESYQQSLARKKEKFVIAVCDLDKFKSVNDTYGHDVGDLVLKHFANILRKTLRPTDVIARMGGEEFVILLTNTNAAGAQKILDRLRQNTEKTPCKLIGKRKGQLLSFTTSIGYAEGPLRGENTLDTFAKIADIALYKAKEEGRNRVIDGRPLIQHKLPPQTTEAVPTESSTETAQSE